MSDWKTSISKVKQAVTEYVTLNIKQIKFEAIEYIAKERAQLVFNSMLLLTLMLVLVFCSLFVAMLLNAHFQSLYLGFGFVALGWLALLLLLFLFGKSIRQKLFDNYADKNIPS